MSPRHKVLYIATVKSMHILPKINLWTAIFYGKHFPHSSLLKRLLDMPIYHVHTHPLFQKYGNFYLSTEPFRIKATFPKLSSHLEVFR